MRPRRFRSENRVRMSGTRASWESEVTRLLGVWEDTSLLPGRPLVDLGYVLRAEPLRVARAADGGASAPAEP